MRINSPSWITFKRLWTYILPYKSAFIVAIIGLLVNAGVEAGLISLIKPLLDDGLMGKNYGLLSLIAIGIVVLIALRGLSNYISTYCLAWLSGKIIMTFRQQVFSHFVRSPVSFHDQNSVGELVTIITFNAEQVSQASSDALIVIVRESMYAIALLAIMFYGSWKLSLVLFIVIPLVIFVAQRVSSRFRQTVKALQRSMGTITTVTDQMLKGHKEVLIYNAKQQESMNFKQISEGVRKALMKITAISALATPIVQLIASCGLGVILFVTASAFIDITPGSFTVVFSAMVAFMRPMRELTSVNMQFQRGFVACDSLFAILDGPLEKDHGTLTVERVQGNITFDQVTYTYPTRTEPALNSVSFSIAAGETVALVGRSGSGKTTIANLVARFYDVEQGQVLIDNININDYTLASLRAQIGLVSQQVHLFNDTIANNIAYGQIDKYSREQIVQAAEMANARDFIDQMEHGFDTVVGDNGVLLSGGQRQRIAIARVLLRDNPILILDEATSALDLESERAVQSALERLQQNRTSIVIAHRLSTIENADRIFVIDNGKLAEQGNHAQLLALGGIYAQMYQMQFGENGSFLKSSN